MQAFNPNNLPFVAAQSRHQIVQEADKAEMLLSIGATFPKGTYLDGVIDALNWVLYNRTSLVEEPDHGGGEN